MAWEHGVAGVRCNTWKAKLTVVLCISGTAGCGVAEPDSIRSSDRVPLPSVHLSAADSSEVCSWLGNHPLWTQTFQRAH